MTRCRHTDDGYVLPSHLPDCRERGCAGCEPCTHDDAGNPVRHCKLRPRCASHLRSGEHVCPTCLGKIRSNLAGITDASALMLDEAIEVGVDSEAANLAGPSANLIVAGWRKIDAVGEVEDWDLTDPYTVLAMRERWIREDLGHDEITLVGDDLTAVVGYLSWVLTDLARDEKQTLVLADLMAETARLRSHLEAVLHDSRTPERGAPCPACPEGEKPRLLKRWATWDTTGAHDTWRCPADGDHSWSEADYRLRVGSDYLDHAERLTASQMQQAHGIKPGSLTAWASKLGEDGTPMVRKRGKDQHGRQLYDVADARWMAGQVEARA